MNSTDCNTSLLSRVVRLQTSSSGVGAAACDRTGVNKHNDRGSFPLLHHRGPFTGFISVSADSSEMNNKATVWEK